MTKPSLSAVIWNDAHSPGATEVVGVDQLDKIHAPLIMTTVGWILRDDHFGVTIAGVYCGDGDYRNVTFIPRVLIVDTQKLSKPKKKAPKGALTSFDGGITAATKVVD
jgi:hypothetical protein